MFAIEILLCFLALAMLVPVTVFSVQVLVSLPVHRPSDMPGGRRPAVAVLVPAHNESLLIAGTLRSIAAQLVAGDRLVVVADNCTDDTAKIATDLGAEVIERTDSERHGKGYALDFGVRHSEQRPPEVVVIVDADCEVRSGSIERLARVCSSTGRPVQGTYLMHSPADADFRVRVAEFAWLVKGWVRPLGYHRLGLPCQLMGTGMAFPWPAISAAALAGGHLQEETRLGIDLTQSGTPQIFCPEALVTSYFPRSDEGMRVQRTQWEHGHLGLIASDAPRLFVEAMRHGNLMLAALVLDLCVPPLALLVLLALLFCACGAAFLAMTGVALPLWLALAALLMLATSVLLSWARYGRRVIALSSLCYAPVYALWKIPLYWKFLVRRHTQWVRTRRDGE